MGFLYFLEALRNPVMDAFFLFITHLGEETFFLAISLFVLWCVDKRAGYYILLSGLFGTFFNQSLKLLCRVPRPWVLDPEFTAVSAAVPQAGGYSFPSGHSQNAVATFGAAALMTRRRVPRILMIALAVLIPFSRMWLGVHTPWDVLGAAALALVLMFAFRPIFSDEEHFSRAMPFLTVAACLVGIAALLFVFGQPPEIHTGENLAEGKKNLVTLCACAFALVPVWHLDRHFVRFDTHASWYAQCLKLLLGIGTTLLLKWGLTTPLNALIPNVYFARGVRYFLVVLYAGLLFPMTFRFFSRLRIPALGEWTQRFGRSGKHDTPSGEQSET